jgi:carbohydrate kinase (thermoresistant glucokinase family)
MTDIQIVVMGVSGCGKSTVGLLLANELGCRFIDGDDLHPQANREKMASGTPLNDEDRWPWLDLVGRALAGAPNPVDGFELVKPTGTVVACSALKRSYRDRILASAPRTFFVHLHGSPELLAERMNAREGHFMKASMLESQLATLEHLAPGEPGKTFDVSLPVEKIIENVVAELNHYVDYTEV